MATTASTAALFSNGAHVDSAGNDSTGWGRIGGEYTLLGMTDPRIGAINL